PLPPAAQPGPTLLAACRRAVPAQPAVQSAVAAGAAAAQDRRGQRDRLAPAPAGHHPARAGGHRALSGCPAGHRRGPPGDGRTAAPASGTDQHAAAGLRQGEAGPELPGATLPPRPAPLPGLPRRERHVGFHLPDPTRRYGDPVRPDRERSEEHTSELQSRENLVCRLLLEKKKKKKKQKNTQYK